MFFHTRAERIYLWRSNVKPYLLIFTVCDSWVSLSWIHTLVVVVYFHGFYFSYFLSVTSWSSKNMPSKRLFLFLFAVCRHALLSSSNHHSLAVTLPRWMLISHVTSRHTQRHVSAEWFTYFLTVDRIVYVYVLSLESRCVIDYKHICSIKGSWL